MGKSRRPKKSLLSIWQNIEKPNKSSKKQRSVPGWPKLLQQNTDKQEVALLSRHFLMLRQKTFEKKYLVRTHISVGSVTYVLQQTLFPILPILTFNLSSPLYSVNTFISHLFSFLILLVETIHNHIVYLFVNNDKFVHND